MHAPRFDFSPRRCHHPIAPPTFQPMPPRLALAPASGRGPLECMPLDDLATNQRRDSLRHQSEAQARDEAITRIQGSSRLVPRLRFGLVAVGDSTRRAQFNAPGQRPGLTRTRRSTPRVATNCVDRCGSFRYGGERSGRLGGDDKAWSRRVEINARAGEATVQRGVRADGGRMALVARRSTAAVAGSDFLTKTCQIGMVRKPPTKRPGGTGRWSPNDQSRTANTIHPRPKPRPVPTVSF